MLPAGPLREPVSRLDSVDAVLCNGGIVSGLGATEFAMHLEGSEFRNLADATLRKPASAFNNPGLHAVAGIGNPQRFFSQLRKLGLTFAPHAFPDHHRFSPEDLDFPGANAVLMTEKDAIKCADFARENWWVLPVEARIDTALADAVIRKIGTAHGH